MKKLYLESDCDCDGCGHPLMAGEAAWIDGDAVGCCQPCCRDALAVVVDRVDVRAFRQSFDAEPFALTSPVNGKPAREVFKDNRMADGSKRPQKVLFGGSRSCIAGQSDLFS
jgi:hypothetical protein